jgi:hypothetical protein
MNEYLYNKRVRNAPIRRRLDRRFVSWVMVSACVGAVVASGFVYSARCHFEAVAIGYETQLRREELAEQEERRRQLELERVKATAPEEIEHRARRMGLRAPEQVVRTAKVGAPSPKQVVRTAKAVAPSPEHVVRTTKVGAP